MLLCKRKNGQVRLHEIWRVPMARVPAFCPHCGHAFSFEGFIGGTGAGAVRLEGNKTICPQCGEMANIVDGTFSLNNDEVDLIEGPPLTHALILQLQKIVQSSKDKHPGAEEILAEVAEISPELAARIRKRGLPALAIILLLIWLIKSVSLNIDIDLNRLIDQAQGVAEHDSSRDVLDTPLPIEPTAPSEHPRSILAETQGGQMSRQVRRQLERRARKLSGKSGSRA
jgi:ribosomal protein S27AE